MLMRHHTLPFSQDVILGKIYFLLVRIKIKFMELAVIRREAAGKIIHVNNMTNFSGASTETNILPGTNTKL